MNKVTAKILYDEIVGTTPYSGLYVWAVPDSASILKIIRLIEDAPFKTENGTKIHTTVLFHKGKLPFEVNVPEDRPMKGVLTHLDMWRDEEGETIIVGHVDSPDLKGLHYELKVEGFEHAYHEYNAHITLAKNVDFDNKAKHWFHEVNLYLEKHPLKLVYDEQLKAVPV